MLIKSITLENFKGIQEQTRIELKPITLLFGANSAGKSTILQALLYAREVLDRHNLDPDKTMLGGDLIDLGGFENLVNNHDLSKDIVIGFELDISNQDIPNYLSETESHFVDTNEYPDPNIWLSQINFVTVKIRIKWSELLQSPIVKSVNVYINDDAKLTSNENKALLSISSTDDAKSIYIHSFDIEHPIFQTESNDSDDQTSELLILWDEALYAYVGESVGDFIADFQENKKLYEDINAFIGFESLIPVYLYSQKDALPNKNLPLSINRSAFKEGEDRIVNNLLVTETFFISLLSSLLVGPIDLIRDELDKLIYIGPLRELPSRQAEYHRSPDIASWSSGSAAWNVLNKANDSFIENLNKWLDHEDKLNSGYIVNVKKFRELDIKHPISHAINHSSLLDEDADDLIQQLEALPIKTKVMLHETASKLDFHPYDIGVGISQLLPVVIAVLHQRSGILAVEQPELHIHPRLQVALGDLFASQVREGTETFYLLETHSEHLILRLLRRIRETNDQELPPGAPSLTIGDVSVLYVENKHDGVKISNLRIDEDGDFIDRWPSGFFDERAGELF